MSATVKSVRHRIAETYRERILSGELPGGSSLPGTRELAAHYRTSLSNAHAALAELSREGLITRLPYHGTVVNHQKRELATVGVVLFTQRMTIPLYVLFLTRFLRQELRRRHLKCRFYLEASDNSTLRSVQAAIQRREYQAILLLQVHGLLVARLPQLTIPYLQVRGAYRTEQLVAMMLAGLKRQGCRRVGVLTSLSRPRRVSNEVFEDANRTFFQALRKSAAELGLELLPEWLLCPGRNQFLRPHQYHRFAYETMRQAWERPDHPDGIMVYPDELLSGFHSALYKAGIRVPEDLKLALACNRELHLEPPYPCTLVLNTIRDEAKTLIEALIARYHGRVPERTALDYEVIDYEPDYSQTEQLGVYGRAEA